METNSDKNKMMSAMEALRKDLLADGGPKISTMKNYRFCILPYNPKIEYELRAQVKKFSDELKKSGWNVLLISLYNIFLKVLKKNEPHILQRIIERESRLYKNNPERAFNYLKEKIISYMEEPDGIASEVIKVIDEFAAKHIDEIEQTLIFIERAGTLYPFFRSSSLLKFLDGKTKNIPLVLFYPGEKRDISALSFMGELSADRDYRPRIYT